MGRAARGFRKRRLRSARPRNNLFPQDLRPIDPGTAYLESEAARLIRVSAATLRTWRSRKLHPELKFRKVGKKRVVYMVSALLDFVNGN